VKIENKFAILITKDKRVFLNFKSPVGKLMIKKIIELLDLFEDVSKNK